jgi:hypothetical protein
MDQQVLDEIVKSLNADASNYTVFLRFVEVPLPKPVGNETILRMVLGAEAMLGGIQKVEKTSVWPSMKEALLYAGDKGTGPAEATLASARMLALMVLLENEVRSLVDAACTTESFWLQSGHPGYPVFWDFAFLLSGKNNASILMGSGSD